MSPTGFSPTAATAASPPPSRSPKGLRRRRRRALVGIAVPAGERRAAPGAAPPGNAASWFGGQSGSVDAESMSDADLLGLVTDDGGSGAVDGD